MKLGKTYHEKYKEEQEYLASLYQKKFTSFAWFPTKMEDGRWVWLETYEWSYNINKHYATYSWTFSEYYKTKKALEKNK